MPKENPSVEKPQQKPERPARDTSALETDAASQVSALTRLSGGSGNGDGNPLPKTRFQSVQRQTIALQVARTQGNRHLQRLVQPPSSMIDNLLPPIQRQSEAPAAPAPGEAEGAPAPAGLLVEDEAGELQPGQMRKTEFMARLQPAVCAAAEESLSGTIYSAAGCPYIEYWFNYYRDRDSLQIERALRRFAPETAQAESAEAYIPALTQRVRRGVSEWVESTQTPASEAPEGEASPTAPEAGAGEGGEVQMKAAEEKDAIPLYPQAIQDRLGEGASLESGTRARMEDALGGSLDSVRVHSDSTGAQLSSEMGARAFTVGEHMAFGPNEYQPGTPIGDALIAHELAHVLQQRGGTSSSLQTKGDGVYSALEADADRSAVGAVLSLWSGMKVNLAGLSQNALPRLRSGLRLQRCGQSSSPSGPAPSAAPAAPPIPTTVAGPAQHTGSNLPDAATQAFILGELNPGMMAATPAPTSGPTPTPTPPARQPWDGLATTPTGSLTPAARAARNRLKRDLTAALLNHLRRNMPGIRVTASNPRLPITSFEGPGRAAKQITDRHYSAFTSTAALTPGQASVRHGFDFRASGPNQTLFDAFDPSARAAAGVPISAPSVTWWMAGHDSQAQTVQQRHHFDPNQSASPEETFFVSDILNPFVSAHRADLELYDRFGFAFTSNTGDRISMFTELQQGLSTTPGPAGRPSPAERATRWNAWFTLIHEYLHTLAHPTFNQAQGGGNPVMNEGFCEMFTKEVIDAELAAARTDVSIRTQVEGTTPPPPAPTPDILPTTYTSPADYLTDRNHAQAIRARIGNNAVKAAYFQGHVEYLGLQPSGASATPVPTGAMGKVHVPSGVATLAQLAAASNMPESDIQTANPGVNLTAALPGTLNLPNCRDHMVVAAQDASGTRTPESRQQIAAQNGVSEADLVRANPAVNWSNLSAGDLILIPRH